MKVIDFKAAKATALAEIEPCENYHCPGDCGRPHNSKERKEYASLVLKAFDDFEHKDNRDRLEKAAEIRRKARNQF